MFTKSELPKIYNVPFSEMEMGDFYETENTNADEIDIKIILREAKINGVDIVHKNIDGMHKFWCRSSSRDSLLNRLKNSHHGIEAKDIKLKDRGQLKILLQSGYVVRKTIPHAGKGRPRAFFVYKDFSED